MMAYLRYLSVLIVKIGDDPRTRHTQLTQSVPKVRMSTQSV